MTSALEIIVKGIVQGVGFRPFVYRCAKKHLVSGWVYNDIEGVFIHAEAQEDLLNAFVDEISNNAPSAAKISEISLNEVPLQHPEGFEIRFSGEKETDIFIYPGYQFKAVDCLVTNFHLPESTLVMLVSALAGREHVLNAYNEAIKERYRFFSFGDACFFK